MKFRKWITGLFVLALMGVNALSEEASVLVLPENLRFIEAEAFCANASIQRVVIPEGTLEIGARAFADSSLAEIILPESLEFIADDAFEGCGDVIVEAAKGTYAFDWCVAHGMTGPELLLECAAGAEACLTGETIHWTAEAAGGKAPYRYSGILYIDGKEAATYNSTDCSEFSVVSDLPGTYSLHLSVSDAWGTVTEAQSDDVQVFTPISLCLTQEQIGLNIVRLAWNGDAGSTAVQYQVETADTEEGPFVPCSEVTFGNEAALAGLSHGKTYYFRVKAIGTTALANGSSFSYEAFSNPVICTPQPANCSYSLQNGKCLLTRAALWPDAGTTELTFPSEIDGYPVALIGRNVLAEPTVVTKVTLPDGVETIGDCAFYGCVALTAVQMSDSVTEIDEYAFAGCTALKDLTLSDSITHIGDRAFMNTAALKQVSLPAALVSLGTRAFYGSDVTSFALPDGLAQIGTQAFGLNVEEITTGKQSENFESLNNVLYTSDGEELVCIPSCRVNSTYVAPHTLARIRDYAFSGNETLQTVELSPLTAHIGNYAFEGCTSLTAIINAHNLVSIGDHAFDGCTTLNDALFDELKSLESAGSYAFAGCTALEDIAFPETFSQLGIYAFGECTGLTSVCLPAEMDLIGDAAFYGCTALERVSMPERVTATEEFGGYLFYGCSSLSDISLPSGIQKLGSYCFYECENLFSATLPEDLAEIGYCAFFKCRQLENINLPGTLTLIDGYAFSYCSALSDLELPACEIGKYAFAVCRGLKNVSFVGDSEFSINENAFYYCSRLKKVVLPSTVAFIDETAFRDCPKVVLYVEDGSVGHAYALAYEIPFLLVPQEPETEH